MCPEQYLEHYVNWPVQPNYCVFTRHLLLFDILLYLYFCHFIKMMCWCFIEWHFDVALHILHVSDWFLNCEHSVL
jgi:hypothetical protein